MIHGYPLLMSIRKQGFAPDSVWLSVGVPYIEPKYQHEFESPRLVADGSVTTDDWRAFKGLVVTLYVREWNSLASDCLEGLQRYAKQITVLCSSYGEDIGFQWHEKYGMLDFGLLGWLEDFHEARKRVCTTEEETRKRVADENKAKANLPLPPEEYRGPAA